MHRRRLFIAGVVLLLTACATPPDPLEFSEVDEIEATVVAINVADRHLILRGPDGNEVGLRVGPEVRNLAQVQPGDILRVRFYSGLTVAMATPGEAGEDLEIAAGRTAEGDLPGGMVGTSNRSTVEILSVATDGTAVSFRDADGRVQSVDVPREEGRAFARKLKRGDLVDIVYTETLAVSVEHAD